MKLSLCVFSIICSTALVVLADPPARAQNPLDTKVNINLNDVGLKEALDRVTQATGVKFCYGNRVARSDIKISLSSKGETLKQLLNR
ncbi:MAG TPA: hypothetical protein VD772_09070, partial [Anseongella sp.]|nr:hypothetical protein [Anseongella sp.]